MLEDLLLKIYILVENFGEILDSIKRGEASLIRCTHALSRRNTDVV